MSKRTYTGKQGIYQCLSGGFSQGLVVVGILAVGVLLTILIYRVNDPRIGTLGTWAGILMAASSVLWGPQIRQRLCGPRARMVIAGLFGHGVWHEDTYRQCIAPVIMVENTRRGTMLHECRITCRRHALIRCRSTSPILKRWVRPVVFPWTGVPDQRIDLSGEHAIQLLRIGRYGSGIEVNLEAKGWEWGHPALYEHLFPGDAAWYWLEVEANNFVSRRPTVIEIAWTGTHSGDLDDDLDYIRRYIRITDVTDRALGHNHDFHGWTNDVSAWWAAWRSWTRALARARRHRWRCKECDR